MIKKLKRNFVLLSMGSLFLVMAVLLTCINLANFRDMHERSDEILQALADNGGNFTNFFSNNFSPFGGMFGGKRAITEETPYESRYFTVVVNRDGYLVGVDTGKIASVDTDEAISLAQEAVKSGEFTDYIGNFKYLISTYGEYYLIIFLDCTRELYASRKFLIYSIEVAVACLVLVFLPVLILSGRIVRPFAENYRKQKQFITDAGHEIKTPLTVISSCTEVIEMEQGESKWTVGIHAQVNRLTSLTAKLISLAKMDEKGSDFVKQELNLSELVHEAADAFESVAATDNISIIRQIEPDITCSANREMMQELCSILLDNSLKYTCGDQIHLTLRRRNHTCVLTTVNPAEGYRRGTHNELFDRFRRGDDSHNSSTPGYGIGLAMAKSIVEKHNGKAEAFSSDGQNLTISVKIAG